MDKRETPVSDQLRLELEMVKEMTGKVPHRVGIRPEAYDALCAEHNQTYMDIFDGVRLDKGIAPAVEEDLRNEGIDVDEWYRQIREGELEVWDDED